MIWFAICTVCTLLISGVSGQGCTDTVGYLSYNINIVTQGQTFILAGYTLPCNGTVVAWKFCYRISNGSVTFYPGIWRITETTGGNIDYELVQSNNITYDQSVQTSGINSCQRVNLSTTDQFTAPAGSVVGLYSNVGTQLLSTNTMMLITTYKFTGNQSSVSTSGNSNDVNYNIAIVVYLESSASTDSSSKVSPTATNAASSPTISTTESSTSIAIPPDNSTQIDSDDSSSSFAGVVAGCVVGVVLIVAIVVLLLCYLKRRRRNKSMQGAVSYKLRDPADSNRFSEQRYYQMDGHEPGTNGMIKSNEAAVYETADNCGYYPSLSNSRQLSEIMRYMNPTTVTVKNHPKVTSGDYEYISRLDTSHYEMACQYEEAIPPTIRDNPEYAEPLPFNEPLYEDPGHKEEKIYAWFEKRKFRTLKRNDITILQPLGSGEFGVVNLGLWSNGSADPVQVAVKTLNSQCPDSDRDKFLREAAIMYQFVHGNVVKLHGVVTKEENMMIVLEYMPKGDLRDNLIYLKTLTPPEGYSELKHDLLRFCRQIAAGMNYLANKQFVHRDLAARNILISSDDVCKIGDFGMARDVSDDTYYIAKGGKIPVKWTAPEALFYKKYTLQSDIWSFGCVMYEIWSMGRKPAEDVDEYIEKISIGYRVPPPPGCPRAIYELMIECWHPTARNRPLARSVLQTLQKSDNALLTSSTQVPEDEITKDNQSMMLGAPLTAGSQLYLDLQQRYTTS